MTRFLIAALPACLIAAPAAAVPLPGTGLTVNGEAMLMSDFRFRGVSRSEGDPALQGSLTVAHDSGVYVGARATSLDGLDSFRFRDPRLRDLGDAQVELYAGYGADLGLGLSADGGVLYYGFPGGDGPRDYVEPYASLSYLLGPVEATAGVRYAPAQDGTGDEAMTYVFGELQAGIPLTPVTLTAGAGHQDWGAYGSYNNWSVGGRYQIGPAAVGVRYVDTDLDVPGAGSTVVGTLSLRF